MRPLIGLLGASAVAYRSYRRGSLTLGGALAAAAVGSVVMGAGGPVSAAGLLSFFFSSTALSRYRQAEKDQAAGDITEKGGARDAAQVLANGGAAALFSVLGAASGRPRFHHAALGALAAATADTWATEIGLLSPGQPRSLLGLRPVPKGTSGAVSLVGCAGMGAGAVLLGLIAAGRERRAALPVFVGGVAGGLLDSVLGATLQERRACLACGAATEQRRHRCGGQTRVSGGVAGLDNDAVNALSTLLGGVISAALC